MGKWTSCSKSPTGICQHNGECNHESICDNLEFGNPVSQRFSPKQEPLIMPVFDYSGQADSPASSGQDEEPLQMPKINFSPKANFVKSVRSEVEDKKAETPLVMPVMNFGKPKKKKSDDEDAEDEEAEDEDDVEIEDEEEEEETDGE
jgi:hypothetical protein